MALRQYVSNPITYSSNKPVIVNISELENTGIVRAPEGWLVGSYPDLLADLRQTPNNQVMSHPLVRGGRAAQQWEIPYVDPSQSLENNIYAFDKFYSGKGMHINQNDLETSYDTALALQKRLNRRSPLVLDYSPTFTNSELEFRYHTNMSGIVNRIPGKKYMENGLLRSFYYRPRDAQDQGDWIPLTETLDQATEIFEQYDNVIEISRLLFGKADPKAWLLFWRSYKQVITSLGKNDIATVQVDEHGYIARGLEWLGFIEQDLKLYPKGIVVMTYKHS